jgi:hypothetical protein
MITAEQLDVSIAEAADQNQPLSRVLVQEGFITADEIKRCLYRQTRELLYNLFLLENGVFEYKDARLNHGGALRQQIDIMSVVLEASRRMDEMTLLSRKIPSKRVCFKMSGQIRDQGEIKLNADEWRFLTLIDGRRTVRDLIYESGYDDFRVYTLLDSLLGAGLIQAGAEAPAAAEPALEPPSTLLAGLEGVLRMIRRGLATELAQWPYTLLNSPVPEGPQPAPAQIRNAYRKHFEAWVSNIFADCASRSSESRSPFFADYQPADASRDTQRALSERLGAFASEAEGRAALLQEFTRLLENLLQRLGDLLPVQAFNTLLTEIESALASLNKNLTTLPEADAWPGEIRRVLSGARQMLAEDAPSRFKPGTVFAFFTSESLTE